MVSLNASLFVHKKMNSLITSLYSFKEESFARIKIEKYQIFVETLQRKLLLVLKKDYVQPPKMKLFDLHCYLPVIYPLINEERSYLLEKFI